MFQVLCLMSLKLVIVSKNNLWAFFLPPLILKFISSSYNHKETSKRSYKLFLQGSNHGHIKILVGAKPYLKKSKIGDGLRKNISACLFSFHNIISLSSKEQVDKKTSMFNKANPNGLIFLGM